VRSGSGSTDLDAVVDVELVCCRAAIECRTIRDSDWMSRARYDIQHVGFDRRCVVGHRRRIQADERRDGFCGRFEQHGFQQHRVEQHRVQLWHRQFVLKQPVVKQPVVIVGIVELFQPVSVVEFFEPVIELVEPVVILVQLVLSVELVSQLIDSGFRVRVDCWIVLGQSEQPRQRKSAGDWHVVERGFEHGVGVVVA